MHSQEMWVQAVYWGADPRKHCGEQESETERGRNYHKCFVEQITNVGNWGGGPPLLGTLWELVGHASKLFQWGERKLRFSQTSINTHWKISWIFIVKDCCWSSNTLATWCEGKIWLIGKDPECWERLKEKGEGGERGWDGEIASLTQWTWTWASSGRRWRTGKPGVLQAIGSQRVGYDWVTEQQHSHSLFLTDTFDQDPCVLLPPQS